MVGNTFQVKIEGLDEIVKLYNKAPEIVHPVLEEAIKRSTAVLAENTDQTTVPFVRGDLIRSFKPVDLSTVKYLYARWFPRVDYAKAVQFGRPSSPGRYVPAIKARLVNGKNIGMWPGFPGRHYMEKIRSASTGGINEVFRNAIKVVVEKMSGKV